ncbi:hypothetical protein AB0I94_32450 [Streptomyces sp. NPDC050147]|uniref:hypothetical protein n=1 Tax=Streptomyces sp. NPDC050147 TaxID=3155513 RepID=UPI003449386D
MRNTDSEVNPRRTFGDEDRRGLTALFWSNVNPYGTFRLDMDKRLDLASTVPRPRTSSVPSAPSATLADRARLRAARNLAGMEEDRAEGTDDGDAR